jgi:hypothetical protein
MNDETMNKMGDEMKIYYQIVIACPGNLPMAGHTKYRSIKRARNTVNRLKKVGHTGTLVTLFNGGPKGYGISGTEEF